MSALSSQETQNTCVRSLFYLSKKPFESLRDNYRAYFLSIKRWLVNLGRHLYAHSMLKLEAECPE